MNRFIVFQNDAQFRALMTGLFLGAILALSAWVLFNFRPLASTFVPGTPTVFIDPLYPPGRWSAPFEGKQRLVQEPGYSDIYFPERYNKIRLTVNFENPQELAFAFGVRTPAGPKLLAVPKTVGEFSAVFSRSELALVGGRLGVIFSVPELRTRSDASFMVSRLQVEYL